MRLRELGSSQGFSPGVLWRLGSRGGHSKGVWDKAAREVRGKSGRLWWKSNEEKYFKEEWGSNANSRSCKMKPEHWPLDLAILVKWLSEGDIKVLIQC